MIFRRANNKKSRNKQYSYNDVENINNVKGAEISAQNVKSLLGPSNDIVTRELFINGKKNLPITLIYIDGLINNAFISEYVLKPLSPCDKFDSVNTEKEIIRLIQEGAVCYVAQRTHTDIKSALSDILSSSAALIFDSEKTIITFNAAGFEKRSITEPTTENVVKGSKDTFIEVLRVNTATVRRKIRSCSLRIEETIVGRQSNTPISIVYMEGITNPNLVAEIKKRLNNIDIDEVTSTGYIETFIIDNIYSPFPQIISTERPDKFCSGVVSGRVGIIIDGLPVTFIAPGDIEEFLHAPEDYSQNFIVASLVRSLRYINMIITLLLPGFYIAVLTFHLDMIPTDLALSIEASKEGVPFPTFAEVLFMLIAFEMLVEAGLRLPKPIGQTISIVGALVVGQAAVSAKLVSQAVVVVIAITAIASFTMVNQDFSNALRVWRFIIAIFSSITGILGVTFGAILLLFHLSKLETFGVPYLSPYVANEYRQMEDSFFRLPLFLHKKRPIWLKTLNKRRQQ